MIDLPEGSHTLTSEQIQHLHFLLQPYYVPVDYEGECPEWMNEDFFSYMHFAYFNPNDVQKDWHGYAGYCKSDDSDNGFLRFYEPLPEVNLYVCPNGFRTWNSRKKEKLIALQNVVIDLDAHDCELSVSELQDHIKEVIPQVLDKLILQPNFVSYTGRGVHFWYCMEPCSCALMETVEKAAVGLSLHVQSILSELGESVLGVDAGASKKPSGLFRVPYTYNLKSCTWGEGQLLHYNRPHVNVLYHALDEINCIDHAKPKVEMKKYEAAQKKKRKKYKKEKRKKPGLKYTNVGLYRGAFIHRKAFVEYLFNSRDTVIGQRHTLFYMLAHAVYNLSDSFDDTYSYMLCVNSTLSEPMLDTEIKAITTYVYNHNWKITNDKFLEFCNATDAEVNYFNRSTEKKKQKAAAAKKKLDRDTKIFELWDNGCTNIAEIAHAAGCSRDTVYRVTSQLRF